MIELFEVCGSDPTLIFSPYCWRVRLALAHKGLPVTWRTVGYADKPPIAFSGQTLLPIIRDGDITLHDSFAIIRYLDRHYPDCPLDLEGPAGQRALLIDQLVQPDLVGGLFRLLVLSVEPLLSPDDRLYFREKYEGLLGSTFEAFAEREKGIAQLEQAFAPLEAQLQRTPYLDGETPSAVDFLVGGFFFWAWVLHETPWVRHPGLSRWFKQLLERYQVIQGPIQRAPNVMLRNKPLTPDGGARQ